MKTQFQAQFSPMMFSIRAKGKLELKRTPLFLRKQEKLQQQQQNQHFIKKLYIINNKEESVQETLAKYYTNRI